jgi:Tol biopolymer transport system component/tRNA A-37 threonylcarbamoyl transferase component Bud32
MTSTPTGLTAALADRYRIERELGAGGMATVYLAEDLKHHRKVAVKVLRPELAAVIGADRFLVEIRTTANLQHPHILPLHDSGEADSFHYSVMPYVEGESLRDRLNRETQLPVADAVRIATEVASALDYAHRHGVIHRDIKPENILLHDGSALVADFGIALAASKAGGTRMTETGMSLGTPHYMSPEQAMGEREITARSDVYALGAVTYEMLVGEPPFTGPTAQAIVAKVMTEVPRPLVPKRHTIPPNVEAAVLKSLEKLAADRFASAAEFTAALADPGYRVAASTVQLSASRFGPPAPRLRRWLPTLLAGLVGVALGAALFSQLRTPVPPPVHRFGLALPAAQAPDPEWLAIPSPDGSRIAYVGPAGDGTQLWIKRRDRYEATPLVGTLGVTNFTWSPDGEWIGFALGTQLRKIPAGGGGAITLADTVSGARGLAWLDDGSIVYVRSGSLRLRKVPDIGGTTTDIFSDSATLLFPVALPGSRGLLFSRCAGSCSTQEELWAFDIRTGRAHQLVQGATTGQYLKSGHIVYVRRDGAMFAAPFNLGSLEITGPQIPVMDSIAVVNGVAPLFALSESGTLVMRLGVSLSSLQRFEMVWVDQRGRITPVDSSWTPRFTEFGGNVGWSLSPDGKRLAIGLATDAGDDIWVKQLPRGPLSRVSYDSASEYRPRWMPDGRTIMFGSNRAGSGTGGLYRRNADGTGADSMILRADQGVFEGAWSPDGKWLLFRTGGTVQQAGGRDIVGIRPGVDAVPVPVVATPYDEEAIALSPDGSWMAYESNETGRTEVYLRPFPNTNAGKWQVSNGGAVAPLWARNGRELYFVSANGDMMVVAVTPGTQPRLSDPRVLFHFADDLYMTLTQFYTPFDVGPDGRFIMARRVVSPTGIEAPLIVVDNWFEELRQKLRSR